MRKLALIIALIVLAAVASPARATDSPQAGDACTTANQVTINGGAEDGGARDFLICTANVGTWTAETAAEADHWNAVAFGNNTFLAVTWAGGTYYAMTSPDGINWTGRTVIAGTWVNLAYGSGVFASVYNGSGMTSPDGITWTSRTGAENNAWNAITYGNGQFVAVASSGTHRVETSPDGITWTAQTAAEANPWSQNNPNGVTYGNGLFVAVAGSGTHEVMTSPDGITWTARTAASASAWSAVAYGNGLFVATGIDVVMTSPDGITWTSRTSSLITSDAWAGLTYANGLFVATGVSNGDVMTSPDGITWTQQTQAESNQWVSVTYGNGTFVAVAWNGTHRVMISNTTWNSTVHLAANGNVGIGNTAPGALLDIGTAGSTSGTLRLEGSGSGYVQLQPAAAAGSWTATLPGNAGTSGYVLQTNGSGTLSWTAPAAGTATTALNSVTAAAASNMIDNMNYAQTWNWSTITTNTALTLSSNSLTSGSLLSLADTNAAASGGTVLKVSNNHAANGTNAIASTASATSGQVTAVKGVASGGSPNGIAIWSYCTGGGGCVGATSNGAIGLKGYASNPTLAGAVGVMGQVDATGAGPAAVDGTSTGATGTNYGVYGTDASASGYGGYFTNTAAGAALQTGPGTTILGAGGTAFSAMGFCTVASYTPTNTTTNVTCTGVPASASVSVTCSATAAFQTPNTTAIYARATGTASQIAVNLSAANNVAMTLKCAWVQPSYGYFVMSKTTWNGNLGDLSGADAKCLTDLTTNTGWMGYAEANTRGVLNSGHVHAWLCDDTSGCNNLNGNTTYYFADANNSANGGSSVATNSTGDGPNAAAVDWSQASYFGSGYIYWTGYRNGHTENTSPPSWGTANGSVNGACGGSFSNGAGGNGGCVGTAGGADWSGANAPIDEYGGWWNCGGGVGAPSCTTAEHLICYVNP